MPALQVMLPLLRRVQLSLLAAGEEPSSYNHTEKTPKTDCVVHLAGWTLRCCTFLWLLRTVWSCATDSQLTSGFLHHPADTFRGLRMCSQLDLLLAETGLESCCSFVFLPVVCRLYSYQQLAVDRLAFEQASGFPSAAACLPSADSAR